MVSWQPPPTGAIKVNFDGLVNQLTAPAGFVIRDYSGTLFRAGGKLLPISEPCAEVIAAWLRCYVARTEFQVPNIYLEENLLHQSAALNHPMAPNQNGEAQPIAPSSWLKPSWAALPFFIDPRRSKLA